VAAAMKASVQSDALVFFGATGDLAHKKVLPALDALVKAGSLRVPVIGVGRTTWTLSQFRQRVKSAITDAGGVDDSKAFERLMAQLRYVQGDSSDEATFAALKLALDGIRHPAFYLATPPALFAGVIKHLAAAGLAKHARLIIEKPFGNDLASARALNRVARAAFPEDSIFRIDHFLGKEPVENILYTRFANSFLEPIWNCDHIASVQITLGENFGVEGRGRFYDATGCLRDVVQNHLFQIVALLGMDPPASLETATIRREKAKLFRAIRPLVPHDLVRGQFRGYRSEPGVAADSDVETFCALKLHIESRRWEGVRWHLRAGKNLAHTVTEVLVRLTPPAAALFADHAAASKDANYLRFRISPDPAIALAARVKRIGEAFIGDQRELYLLERGTGEESAYERLIGDAMVGNGALFAGEKTVEAAWAVVDPILSHHGRSQPYEIGSWGPKGTNRLIAPDRWNDPAETDHPRAVHEAMGTTRAVR